jgi:putative GTP pyrophosphokinase
MVSKISRAERKKVDDLVTSYANDPTIRRFLKTVVTQILDAMEKDGPLIGLVHSLKYRMKDPGHLRQKLFRKIAEYRDRGRKFDPSAESLSLRITDLAGCRLLHLHTRQMEQIHKILLKLISEAQCELFEKPFAYVWDDEWRKYFQDIGIRTKPNPRLYSSVHYVIRPNNKAKVTCEIQVRTLADEIWGEIDHRLNYPEPHKSVACKEQIVALARVTSSCGRLVDSIIASDKEFASNQRTGRR